jgi:hypothetical protein
MLETPFPESRAYSLEFPQNSKNFAPLSLRCDMLETFILIVQAISRIRRKA